MSEQKVNGRMCKCTLDSVRRVFWKGRFQPQWCSSQPYILSHRGKHKELQMLKPICNPEQKKIFWGRIFIPSTLLTIKELAGLYLLWRQSVNNEIKMFVFVVVAKEIPTFHFLRSKMNSALCCVYLMENRFT